MKKYVNAKNVIGLILGLLAIVVFCILKHPVWAILIGITTTAAFWVPNSKILDWVKAGLVTVAICMTIYTIMQVEPIHTGIANAFPAFFWIFTICGTVLTAIIAFLWAWRGQEYYDEEGTEEEENPVMGVVDLTHHTKDEPETVDVYSDKTSGKVLITFGKNRWFLEKGKDKLAEESEGRYVIALRDGSKLIIPEAQSVKAAL